MWISWNLSQVSRGGFWPPKNLWTNWWLKPKQKGQVCIGWGRRPLQAARRQGHCYGSPSPCPGEGGEGPCWQGEADEGGGCRGGSPPPPSDHLVIVSLVDGGEGCKDLPNLVQRLVEGRAQHLARLNGVPTTAGTLAFIVGSYGRILSCTFVQAQESCLLARMGHMDAGARDAAVRRQVSMRQDALAREENLAYFAAHVRGRSGPVRGRLPPWVGYCLMFNYLWAEFMST